MDKFLVIFRYRFYKMKTKWKNFRKAYAKIFSNQQKILIRQKKFIINFEYL